MSLLITIIFRLQIADYFTYFILTEKTTAEINFVHSRHMFRNKLFCNKVGIKAQKDEDENSKVIEHDTGVDDFGDDDDKAPQYVLISKLYY